MADLPGDATPVDLGGGVLLTAPGLTGTAQPQPVAAAPSTGLLALTAGNHLASALSNAGFREHHTAIVAATAAPDLTSDATSPLTLAHPGAGQAAVVLVSDADGRVHTWHFPQRDSTPMAAEQPAPLTFAIPTRRLAARAEAPGMLGGGFLHKIVKVLVYPIPESAIGWTAEKLATAWEQHSRPSIVHSYPLMSGQPPQQQALTDANWRQLSGRRSVLFLHGIFSTSAGAFSGIATSTLQTLATRYEGGLFAFDHPTVSVDPVENARQFLSAIPAGVHLDVDIVSHSRGGLVARILSGELALPDLPTDRIKARRIIFAGTPNTGTPLVDEANIGHLLDRYTSLLSAFPPGPWSTVTTVLSGVLEIVQIVGMGVLPALPGLAAMAPASKLINDLNQGAQVPAGHYAIDANFEPTGGLIDLLRPADGIVDDVFGRAANDVAVPAAGVGTVPGDPGFPVLDRLSFGPGPVWHCTYFSAPEAQTVTAERLLQWLTG
jgi:hypothetical protein